MDPGGGGSCDTCRRGREAQLWRRAARPTRASLRHGLGWRLRLVLLTPLALAGCRTPPPPVSVRATTTVTASARELAVGLAVFRDHGCGSCHTFMPAGAGGLIGPDLDPLA